MQQSEQLQGAPGIAQAPLHTLEGKQVPESCLVPLLSCRIDHHAQGPCHLPIAITTSAAIMMEGISYQGAMPASCLTYEHRYMGRQEKTELHGLKLAKIFVLVC